MPRKKKKTEPWNEIGSIWKTEAAYWSWIRGQIRNSIWKRYPVKNAFVRSKRFRMDAGVYKNGKKKTVWGGTCAMCGENFSLSKLTVDHIIPAGSLREAKDLEGFITKMACSFSNMQLLCKKCHDIKTYSDKYGITLEEAKTGMLVALIKKMPTEDIKKIVLGSGGSEEDTRNKSKRDAFLHDYYKTHWL